MREGIDTGGSASAPSVVALGVFDGVHKGHRALLLRLRREARNRGARSIVYTFDGHPSDVLDPGNAPPRLMTLREKLESIRAFHPDRIVVRRFTQEFAALSAREFLESLLVRFRMETLVAGYDVRLGRGGEGDGAFLTRAARELGFSLALEPPLLRGGRPVSSTLLREMIRGGRVRAARRLGCPARVSGVVVEGKRLGRRIGFPTLNVRLPNKTLPKAGVYRARVLVDGAWRPGVANLGVNPTVETGRREKLEAHVFGYAGDAYGKTVTVEFQRFLRPEIRFGSVEELKAQIARDSRRATRGVRGARLGGGDRGRRGSGRKDRGHRRSMDS